jgi:hypothetical protein
VDQVNTDRNGGLHFSYQINSRVNSSLELMHNERDSNLHSATFTENRLLLTVSYERGPGPAPVHAED